MEHKDTHTVIMAIGCNTAHEANMELATGLLGRIVTDMRCSRTLWTEPVGMKSDRFLNRVVAGRCALEHDELQRETKRIERECGRKDTDKKHGIVRMDIDVLRYDDRTEHPDDWKRKYVKLLIKEI